MVINRVLWLCLVCREMEQSRWGRPRVFFFLFFQDFDLAQMWRGSKKLLTFLGSLYKKKLRKQLPELWYISSRDRPPGKNISSFEKHWVLDLQCRILSQEPSDSCILYFSVIFHGKWAEEDINRQLVTCECSDNWNSWNFGDPLLYHPKWIQSDL